jgi:hypothetical protein
MVGVTTLEAANIWIYEQHIAMYNTAFAVSSDQEGTAFVTDRAGAWGRRFAPRRIVASATTTRSPGGSYGCKFRRVRSVSITCERWCGRTNIRMVSWPSSMVRTASRTIARTARRSGRHF